LPRGPGEKNVLYFGQLKFVFMCQALRPFSGIEEIAKINMIQCEKTLHEI
jgi:hypothetical protein